MEKPDFTAYELHLRNVAGLHPDTVDSHLRHIARFYEFATAQGWRLEMLPQDFMDIYASEMGVAQSVVRKTCWSMDRYCEYLQECEKIIINPFKSVPRLRQRKKVQRYWTPAEIERLLQAAEGKSARALRNRTMLEIFYDTGIRNHELRKLVLPDLNMCERYMLIRGKRYKERLLPLNAGAMYWLEQYLQRRHELFNDKITPVLFPSTKTGEMMKGKSVWSIVKRHAKAAGLDPAFNVHSLRYAFASHMLTNGADLRIVQALLGHSDISATSLYAQLQSQHLHALHRRFHPRAGFPQEGEGKEDDKTEK